MKYGEYVSFYLVQSALQKLSQDHEQDPIYRLFPYFIFPETRRSASDAVLLRRAVDQELEKGRTVAHHVWLFPVFLQSHAFTMWVDFPARKIHFYDSLGTDRTSLVGGIVDRFLLTEFSDAGIDLASFAICRENGARQLSVECCLVTFDMAVRFCRDRNSIPRRSFQDGWD